LLRCGGLRQKIAAENPAGGQSRAFDKAAPALLVSGHLRILLKKACNKLLRLGLHA
jgi:hypothetical protein